MKLTDLIADHLLQVSEGNNWTEVNLADTLRGVTVNQAMQRTPASPNTIASLVHHLAFWNRVMVQRIQGVAVQIPESNGFDVSALVTDEDWAGLREDYSRSAHELATAIRGVDENRLEDPILAGYSSVYKNLQGSVEHIHYHLGQLVLLKNLVREERGEVR